MSTESSFGTLGLYELEPPPPPKPKPAPEPPKKLSIRRTMMSAKHNDQSFEHTNQIIGYATKNAQNVDVITIYVETNQQIHNSIRIVKTKK